MVTQGDVDQGSVLNTALTTGESPDGEDPTDETEEETPIERNPGIQIVKTDNGAVVDGAGDVIVYTLTVSNTGNVTLSNVLVQDPLTGLDVNVGTLNVGASTAVNTDYVVTQADVDAGSVLNTALTTGDSPDGEDPTDETEEETPIERNPSIQVSKTDNGAVVDGAGDVITYTITVSNTGNVTLSNVLVQDPLTGLDVNVGTLAPGASTAVDTEYVVTQGDVDKGSVLNTALTTGDSPDGEDPTDETEEETPIERNPGIQIVKSDNGATVDGAGDVIVYTLTVTNTGNVTLSNVTVQDPLTGLELNVGTLAPGASTAVDTEYAVTQGDVDAGSVLNTAIVTGDSPDGEDPTDETGIETPIESDPSITLDKSVDLNSVSRAGIVLNYTLTVKNTGNVTLTSGELTDPRTGLSVPGISLAPGEERTFQTVYTVTLEDILDGGPIVNVANVNAVHAPSGKLLSAEGRAVVDLDLEPGIDIGKTADKSTISEAGEVVNYTLTVSNTGTAPLFNVTVTDPLTGLEENIGILAPDETAILETAYTVTADDLERGTLVNVAKVTAQTLSEEEVEDSDELVIGVSANEIIANDDDFGSHFMGFGGVIGNILDNDLLEGQRPDPADVDFEFTELDGVIGLLIDENGELSLIPNVNEIRDYTLKYVLREAVNPSNNDDALVFFRILNDNVDLSVTKTSFEAEIYEGDEFEYEIVVSNVGGTPATDVTIVDDLPASVGYVSSTVVGVSDPQIQVGSPVVDGNRISWSVPFLPADGVVTLRVKVKAGDAGTVTNVVVVGSAEDDTNETDNRATDENRVLPFRIPNVITPNGDGRNDAFEIKGLGKFAASEIVIFNRYGDHVLEKKGYQNDWDAPGQVAGTYFYVLKLTDGSGRVHEYKGWIQVIKE